MKINVRFLFRIIVFFLLTVTLAVACSGAVFSFVDEKSLKLASFTDAQNKSNNAENTQKAYDADNKQAEREIEIRADGEIGERLASNSITKDTVGIYVNPFLSEEELQLLNGVDFTLSYSFDWISLENWGYHFTCENGNFMLEFLSSNKDLYHKHQDTIYSNFIFKQYCNLHKKHEGFDTNFLYISRLFNPKGDKYISKNGMLTTPHYLLDFYKNSNLTMQINLTKGTQAQFDIVFSDAKLVQADALVESSKYLFVCGHQKDLYFSEQ